MQPKEQQGLKQKRHFVTPLQGLFIYFTNPGRCPGLSCFGPSGQSANREEIDANIVIAAIHLNVTIARAHKAENTAVFTPDKTLCFNRLPRAVEILLLFVARYDLYGTNAEEPMV